MIFLIWPKFRRKRRLLATRELMATPLAFRADALLELHGPARLLDLLLHLFRLGLGYPFLHGLRCAVDEILGFLEAKAGELTDHLDDLNLLVTGAIQHDGELVLFRSRSGSRA